MTPTVRRRARTAILVAGALVVGYQVAATVTVWRAELAAAAFNAWLAAATDTDHSDRHERSA